MKISAYPVLTAVDPADEILLNDVSAGATKRASLSNVLAVFFPVGSIYSNGAVSTNPGTMFGFGTWVPASVGKGIVGIQSADSDFATLGQTGGEKRHTLTVDEIPNHGHGVNDGGHNHKSTDGADTMVRAPGSTNYTSSQSNYTPISWGSYGTSYSGANISIQGTGGSQSHNVQNPYEVAAVWKRTA